MSDKLENTCHDCGKEIEIGDNDELVGGKYLKYTDREKDYYVLKCDECYEKDPSLRNFKECEVYSRTVGYIRPVQNWNVGKQEEYKDRVEFKNKENV